MNACTAARILKTSMHRRRVHCFLLSTLAASGSTRSVAELEALLHKSKSEQEARRLRNELGTLSCALRGVGPTGGYCLRPGRKTRIGGNDCVAETLAAHLARRFTRILDLGAGLGQYGRWFAAHAQNVHW
eukprot:3896209-Prymnesium_polylepis.1